MINTAINLDTKMLDDYLVKTKAPENFKQDNHAHNAKKTALFKPLESLIKSKKLKPFHEQLLTNISNLATAYAVSDGAEALNLSPYLNLPASFGFMHLTNKGAKDLDKLLSTSVVGMGAIALQRTYKLPKWILKTLVSSIIFTVNNKKINFPMSLFDNSRFKVSKDDLMPLLKKFCKIETVIHTIPNLVNPVINLAKKKFVTENQGNSKYGIALGLYALRVLGLSGGFVTVGNLMHKYLGMGGKGNMDGLTEMLVGACPAEIASSTKAVLLPD